MVRRKTKRLATPVVRVDIVSMEVMSQIFGMLAADDEEIAQEEGLREFSPR